MFSFFTLLFVSVELLAVQSQAEKEIAIGIATPGPGPSMMGHLFLFIGEKGASRKEGVIYEFGMDREDSILPKDENGNVNPIYAFLGKGSRFYLNRYPAGYKTNNYLLENRSVFYYFLNLSQESIEDLGQQLETESKRRQDEKRYDYNFLTSSCLTEMLAMLNPYLVKEGYPKLKFFDAGRNYALLIEVLTSFSVYLDNAPFILAPKLAKHPAVTSTEKLEPELVVEVDLVMKLRKSFEDLDQSCGFKGELTEVIENTTFNNHVLFSNASFDLFKNLKDQCSEKFDFQELILLLYFKANELEDKMRLESDFPEELAL